LAELTRAAELSGHEVAEIFGADSEVAEKVNSRQLELDKVLSTTADIASALKRHADACEKDRAKLNNDVQSVDSSLGSLRQELNAIESGRPSNACDREGLNEKLDKLTVRIVLL
jgi:chromosome segregation ATPase